MRFLDDPPFDCFELQMFEDDQEILAKAELERETTIDDPEIPTRFTERQAKDYICNEFDFLFSEDHNK